MCRRSVAGFVPVVAVAGGKLIFPRRRTTRHYPVAAGTVAMLLPPRIAMRVGGVYSGSVRLRRELNSQLRP